MPKLKGFSNAEFKKQFNVVNLSDLSALADKGVTSINKEVLLENGLLRKKNLPVKLLGKGELTAKVDVVVDKVSTSAKEAVETKGGTIELA
jgi:large subunit ribosomal protein L15